MAKVVVEREAILAAGTCRAVTLAKLGQRVSCCALVVGPRDGAELDLLRGVWPGSDILGIDLFTKDERIMEMDMGKMSFNDNAFHAVLACHSLEHSYDPIEALREFARVLRPGGQLFLEVPVTAHAELTPQRFESGADRWNFGNMECLKRALPVALLPRTLKNAGHVLQLVAVKS